MAEIATLRIQLGQMEALRDTDKGLADQLKAAVAASETNQNELLRLQGQGSRLPQLEQEDAQLKSERQGLVLRMGQLSANHGGSRAAHLNGLGISAPDGPRFGSIGLREKILIFGRTWATDSYL
jgi:hypothetical protein